MNFLLLEIIMQLLNVSLILEKGHYNKLDTADKSVSNYDLIPYRGVVLYYLRDILLSNEACIFDNKMIREML